jgi:hypothetical protein
MLYANSNEDAAFLDFVAHRTQAAQNIDMASNVGSKGTAGPLALPWREAANAVSDLYVTGLSPNPLRVNGALATLSERGSFGQLHIDGASVRYWGRDARLCLNTDDVLGAKVCSWRSMLNGPLYATAFQTKRFSHCILVVT